jgi:endonuclease-3
VPAILDELDRLYPAATCELRHDNPFQLLCATILSAQCTDERVNLVAPTLFARFPTPSAMANADTTALENIIRSTGFFRNKAKNLLGASRMLVERWAGVVPRTMDELLDLPGVARKTANVVLGTAFGIADADLMAIVPRERWILLSHQLIWHGRRICQARKPNCDACPIAPHCPSAFRAT